MLRGLLVSLIVLFVVMIGSSQSSRLASQYYRTGEYEKAADIYLDLYNKNRNSTYFSYYITCLMSMEEYDKVESVLKKEIKKNPSPDLYVSLGEMYERTSQNEKAEKQYRNAIDALKNKSASVSKLANAFIRASKYDLAIETYRKGSEIVKSKNKYAYNLADLYFRKGDKPNMIENYILAAEENPRMLRSIKSLFSRKLQGKEELDLLTEVLYTRIQEKPESPVLPELLEWVHLQNREYAKALRQAIALDLRMKENGKRIYNVGKMAVNDNQFDQAIKAFEYIIDQKNNSPYFLTAQDELMKTKRKRITDSFDYTEQDIRSLESEYLDFLNKYGKNANSARIIANLAELEALYLNDLPKAISLLQELVDINGVEKNLLNQSKLTLGDYYLMQGERWEATLLYSQVDKDLKEAYLGELARFKNARLSYFAGDFTWAQSQFDVLKASTSRLISNDAIDLSVFITDNLGLDSIPTPMEMYAKAELLAFQNKYDEAFSLLADINKEYPDHGLADDIYYTTANIYMKLKDWKSAESFYQKIVDNYSEDIRADNSMFALAELYENQLPDLEKAKSLYERIFLDYSDSTFAVEARKRFRKLRGDSL